MSIKINNLNFIYDKDLIYEKKALINVSMEIQNEGIIGIIGHSGSGKSTLIQHFNGLIMPQEENKVIVDGQDLYTIKGSLSSIRKKVGIVFQYPETQLFEETVKKELSFGPKNIGMSEEEIDNAIRTSLKLVGLDFDKYAERSPFTLSGGEKRKVAIADMLAMKTDYLVLDEPTAGLDPIARKELLENIKSIKKNQGISVIVVSHDMEEIAYLSEYIYVMNESKIVLRGTPIEVFSNVKQLNELHLGVPETIKLLEQLRQKDNKINIKHLQIEEAVEEIEKFLERNKKNAV
ncbi:MAG: energy-coupling factor transporter ATPase [Caldisericia bacterium]|nr:energy-coupling factor transporter ATPase [Caldisericia bacterium]